MKSEKEIKAALHWIKSHIGTTNHPGEKHASGFLSALEWVLGIQEIASLTRGMKEEPVDKG